MIRLIVRVGAENLNRTNYRVFDLSCPDLEKLIKEADAKADELVSIGIEICNDPPPVQPAQPVTQAVLVPATPTPVSGVIKDSTVAVVGGPGDQIIQLPSGSAPVVDLKAQQSELKRTMLERLWKRKQHGPDPKPKLPG